MKKRKIFLLILGALISPFLFYSVPLFLTDGFTSENNFPDQEIILMLSASISVLISSFFIYELPIKKSWKILLALLYCPILVYLLFFFSFLFVGIVFGRWL